MKISQREMMLGVITLACVLTGATWYEVNAKISVWREKKTEIISLRQQINQHQAAIKMQSKWQGQLNTLEKDLRVFKNDKRSVAPELHKTIKAISDKYGLDLTRYQPHDEKPTGNLYELPINYTWKGKLGALVGFLTDLQQQGVRYDIRTLNISPAGRKSGELKGNMIINCAYTRRNETVKPAK